MSMDKIIRALRDLIDSADAVSETWESGDLAGAVNILEGDAESARDILAAYDKEKTA